ncbi:MAG: hemolysin family protein [Ilumatobacteraceae bacterium]
MIAAQFGGAEIGMLFAIFVLLLVLIFLAVAEMSLSRMSTHKATVLAEQGHRAGSSLVKLVSEPERWVNSVLLTVNVCQTVQATLTGIVAGRLFGVWGVVVGVMLNVIVFFVLAEAVPKTYAVLHTERAATLSAGPTSALVAFPPLRWISDGLIGLTNVIMPGKGLAKGPFLSEQELLGIVEAAAEDEVIEERERQLIESIIEFGDTVAREIMVPRPDMVVVSDGATVTDALDIAIAHGYSRLPVLSTGEREDVVGLAYAKDLMKAERAGEGARPIMQSARSVIFIPENKPVAHLMREMQEEKFHLAVVIDEYGEIAGIVTLEDCLEELVGDIVDEYDNEDAEYEIVDDGEEYLVDGAMGITEVGELIGTELPEDGWDTLAGFVFGTMGHVPEVDEAVDAEGWRFSAEVVEGRRIRRVRIVRVAPVEGPTEEVADGDAAAGSDESVDA